MNRCVSASLCAALLLSLAACGTTEDPPPPDKGTPPPDTTVIDLQVDTVATPDVGPDLGVDIGADSRPDLVETPPDIGPDIDDKPPTVISTVPADKATGVKADQVLSVTFSEPMDQSKASPTSFTLETQGVPIPPKVVSGQGPISIFQPAYSFCPLTTYKATVTKAFTDLAQNPLAADYSWSFTSADGSWTAPQSVGMSFSAPGVAIAQTGDAFMAYAKGKTVVVRRYAAAAFAWQPEVTIATVTGYVSMGPVLAADAAGNAVAVWVQDTSADLRASRYDATTGKWSAPAILETVTNKVSEVPSVAMSLSGKAMVVYVQDTATSTAVYYNVHDGTSWGTRQVLPSPGTKPDRSIRVVSNGLEDFYAAWYDRAQSFDWALRVSHYSGVTKAWSTSATQVDPDASTVDRIPLAASPAGAVVGWRARPSTQTTGRRVYAARATGGTWAAAEDVSKNGTSYTYDADVAITLTGDVYVGWYQSGTGSGLKLARYVKSTSTWGAAQTLTTQNTDGLFLVLDATGNGHAIWGEGYTRLRAVRLLAGTPGTPAWLTPQRDGWLDGGSVAFNACGQGIFTSRYSNEGPISPPDMLMFK
jgi:predicted small lipoprotein YifL